MNAQMNAAWRKMCGTAFLWVAIATVVYAISGTEAIALVSCLGFLSFAVGLALFADGMERDIVERIRQRQADN